MRMYDIIQKKRGGSPLSAEEINFFISGYVAGGIPDYQASALMMAIYFRGMDDREISDLTLAMANSGDTVDLSGVFGYTVDKHSTGGVGDKTTLIVAPIVAACGGKVAKMSGRGLGHTGGTIDKLESIKGFQTTLGRDRFIKQVNEIGLCVIGQSGNLAPADKKLYALRDVTATVDSVPLIASSIMSKKLAAGSRGIVLDVKTGSGAFMKSVSAASELAEKMVSIGTAAGRDTVAVITNMDVPLGNAVGNSLEVIEAVQVLSGKGCPDLTEVCLELAGRMLTLALGKSAQECISLAKKSVDDGSALKKLMQMAEAQGGDVSLLENTERFEKSAVEYSLKAAQSGYIGAMNAELIGSASVLLGAGREKKDDEIDYSAGILLKAKTGDYVRAGNELAVLYTNSRARIEPAEKMFLNALEFTDKPVEKQKLIYKVI